MKISGLDQIKVSLPKGPAHYWKVACAACAEGFTVGELAGCTAGVAYSTVQQWVSALKRQGELKIIGARPTLGGKSAHVYAVVRAKVTPPVVRRPTYEGRLGLCQQNLWNAMRRMSHFSLQELCFAASTEGVTIPRNTASKYIAALVRADLIQVVEAPCAGKKGHVGAVAGLWRLKKSAAALGPKAPQIFQAKFVFDPNNGRVIGQAEVQS